MHLVAVVDVHPLTRMALRSQMALSSEFQMVGDAADGVVGLALVRESRPDLVIVDLDLPNDEGLELIKGVRAVDSEIRLLARSGDADPFQVARAIVAGAHGFVEKSIDVEPAMRMLISGYSFFPGDGISQEFLSHARRMLQLSRRADSRNKRSRVC